MRIAFYAPLKSPLHSVPSGDRLIGRLLIEALGRAGHDVALASNFRSFDGTGSATRQSRLAHVGQRLAKRLLARLGNLSTADRPQLWLTYHLYQKAPDWLGPNISKGLGIPYVVVEASCAQKHAHGPWRLGAAEVEAALSHARLVVSLNTRDQAGVARVLSSDSAQALLPPFIDGRPFRESHARGLELREALLRRHGLNADAPILVTVGMMRADQKMHSYRLLAEALGRLQSYAWSLLIIGDGPARREVEGLFKPLGGPGPRIVFLGELNQDEVSDVLAAGDLFVWPGIKEAIGMVYLEAQAAGLPVVASDREGSRSVVMPGETGLLVPEGDVAAFAGAVERLLYDSAERLRLAGNAFTHARDAHDIESVGPRFAAVLSGLVMGDGVGGTT